MATNVVMPQMGESIAEGTIVRWIKKVGDSVDRDEPLFEISTDKVDAEIPAPAAGEIIEILHKEGETVAVNTVVAVIRQAGDAAATRPHVESTPAGPLSPEAGARGGAIPREESSEEALRQRSSPLVRRLAREHGVDISRIRGTGMAGRVTGGDILAFVAQQKSGGEIGGVAAAHEGRVEKMSVMRKTIAERMVSSRRTSAHVHSVFEVNFSRVAEVREAKKAEYERAGAKATFLVFILKAVVDALRAVPIVNASVDGDNILYHEGVNLGIAVALDWGLVVPVIKRADEKSLLELSRSIADLAARARAKQLKPEEVTGGTFTVTNPGVFGALMGMPIINQPQVAILGVGHIEKRPVVVDDTIAIAPMAYLTLGFDHRVIDGAVADQFLSRIKQALEDWDPAA